MISFALSSELRRFQAKPKVKETHRLLFHKDLFFTRGDTDNNFLQHTVDIIQHLFMTNQTPSTLQD